MTNNTWRELRPKVVEEVGPEAMARARRRNQAFINASLLAERRVALGLTQTDVAERIGVTKSRISQIESGEVSTVETMARYVQALGGQLHVSALFGADDQLVLRGVS